MIFNLFIASCFLGLVISECISDSNCIFCAKNTLTCLQCREGFTLNTSYLCVQNSSCSQHELTSADGTSCVTECPSTLIDFINPTTQKNQCSLRNLCPQMYNIASGDQIVDVYPGVLYQAGQTIPINQVKTLYYLEVVSIDTGIQIKKISSDIASDLLRGYKVNGNAELGSCIVVWFASSKVAIYNMQLNKLDTLTLQNVDQETDQILDVSIGVSSVDGLIINLIAKETAKKQISYLQINVNTLNQIKVDTWYYGDRFANIPKLFYVTDLMMISVAINLTNSFVSLNLQLVSSKFVEKDICTLNKITTPAPKILFVKSKNELLYFTQGSISTSSITDCYAETISDQASVTSLVLDEDARKVFTLSAAAIKSYSYDSTAGVKSISEITNTSFDNSSLSLVNCSSLGLIDQTNPSSNLILLCNNLVSNDVTQINYDFINLVVKSSTLFTNSFLIKALFYAKPLKTALVYGISSLRVFQGLIATTAVQQTAMSQGCMFLIQSQFETSTAQQTVRVNAISSSLTSQISSDQKLVYQVTNNINYNPVFDQLVSIRQLLILGTQQAAPIVISPLTFAAYKFKSFKLMAMNVQVKSLVGNIVVNPLSAVNEVVFDTLIFNSAVTNSSLIIKDKSNVIIRKVYFHNFTLANSTLITFINCNQIFIGDVSIHNVNLTDKNSSLFAIIQSTQVTFRNVNITLSSQNAKPMIALVQTTKVIFQNVMTLGNYFSDAQLFGIVFLLSGVDQSIFNNVIIRSNMNVQSYRIVPSYLNLLNQLTLNSLTKSIGSQITIKDNVGRFGQQMFIQTNTAYFTTFTCLNNSQLAGNGTIYFAENTVNIQDSSFINNKAYGGGGIYFNQTQFAQVIGTQFTNNSATAAGGAILISKGLLLLNSTNINNNTAVIGGGVRIEKGKLSFLQYDSNTQIINNKASLFGENVGSRLQKMNMFINGVLITELEDAVYSEFRQKLIDRQGFIIFNAFSFNNMRSGQLFDMLVQLYDQDGKLFVVNSTVTYPPTIALEIKQLGGVIRSNNIAFLGENFLTDYCYARNGYCTPSNFFIQGNPNTVLPMVVIQNFIENPERVKQTSRILNQFEHLQDQQKLLQTDSQIKANQKRNLVEFAALLGILTSDYTKPIGIQISFRSCIIGEVLKEINKDQNITECLPCPQNSFTLTNTDVECKKCPDSAYLCQNSTIVLKNGYWRSSSESDKIFKCRDELSSCVEQSTSQMCKQGYVGPLCEACDIWGDTWGESYSLNGIGGECLACDSYEKQSIYLSLIFIITTVYLLFGIFNAIQNNSIHSLAYYVRILKLASISKSCMRDQSSQYIKVLVHYLQLMAVINSISLQLPEFVSFVPKYSGNPGTSFILSSNCFLQQLHYKNLMQIRVLQSSLLPLVYCFSVILVYACASLFKVIRFQKQFIFTTFIFLIMFFQPDSVMFLLSSIGCKKLGNDNYLLADANYQCYKDPDYHSFLYFYSIPALVVWCLFPVVFLYFLSRRKNKLHLIVTRQLFGYLYLEYKDKYYYFEFFRCLMKILIVVFYTLINSDLQFKLNCVVLFISFYLLITIKIHPFQNVKLFHIDVLTHVVIMIIILFNMISSTVDQDSSNIFYFFKYSYNFELLTNKKIAYYTTIKILTVILNVGYFAVMITIISLLKMNKFNLFFQKVMINLQQRFSKCLPFLKSIELTTPNSSIKVLQRWKFLRNQRKFIVQKHFEEQLKITKGAQQSRLEEIKRDDVQTSLAKQLQQLDQQKQQSIITSPHSATLRHLKSFPIQQTDDQTYRMNLANDKNNIEGENDIFSSGILSQNLDGEKVNFDIEMYSNPVSSKFVFDKNNLLQQSGMTTPFSRYNIQKQQ